MVPRQTTRGELTLAELDRPCSGCGGQRDRSPQRYCYACHATANRRYRRVSGAEVQVLRALVRRAA